MPLQSDVFNCRLTGMSYLFGTDVAMPVSSFKFAFKSTVFPKQLGCAETSSGKRLLATLNVRALSKSKETHRYQGTYLLPAAFDILLT
jgi:hypothetical protein